MVLLTLTTPELDRIVVLQRRDGPRTGVGPLWPYGSARIRRLVRPQGRLAHGTRFQCGARSAQEPASRCPLPESVYAKRGPRHVRPAPPSNLVYELRACDQSAESRQADRNACECRG